MENNNPIKTNDLIQEIEDEKTEIVNLEINANKKSETLDSEDKNKQCLPDSSKKDFGCLTESIEQDIDLVEVLSNCFQSSELLKRLLEEQNKEMKEIIRK